MPLQNFLPGAGGGGVDESKTYLIKGSTLKELLKKTDFAEQDFVVQDKGETRTVSLQRKPSGSPSQPSPGWSGDITVHDCDNDLNYETLGPRMLRLSYENGILVAVNASDYERPLAATVVRIDVQSCHWIDDPPNDDWRNP